MANLGASNATVTCLTTVAFFYIPSTPRTDGSMPPILVQETANDLAVGRYATITGAPPLAPPPGPWC